MVLGIGFLLSASMPQPSDPVTFFRGADKEVMVPVFGSMEAAERYVLASPDNQIPEAYYGSPSTAAERRAAVEADLELQVKLLPASTPDAQQAAVELGPLFARNGLGALQAILPLTGLLLIVLLFVVRERLPNADEVFLGIAPSVLGMALFNGRIELGLASMGRQVGGNLPVLYQSLDDYSSRQVFRDFDEKIVQSAIQPDGRFVEFMYIEDRSGLRPVPFDHQAYNQAERTYTLVPKVGPLFPGDGSGLSPGIVIVLLFAFAMGYAATLAEPALNALGMAVEDLTAGVFKKSLLMQAVAIGVGTGIMVGIMKILWDIPLLFILAPPYLLLLLMTLVSTEDYVNIAWDSAGVTTGPVTVPLVLALGLGIGGQLGIVEGFGILSAASVFPIMAVLGVGLVVTLRRKRKLAAQRVVGGAK